MWSPQTLALFLPLALGGIDFDIMLTWDIYIYIYRIMVFAFTPSPGSSYEYPDYNGEEYDYNDYKDYQEGESTQIPVIRIFIGTAGTGTDTVLVALVQGLPRGTPDTDSFD